MAVIMDEFTYNCFSPECELLQITPNNFKKEINEFYPDLLFIESAWHGKNDLWRFKLYNNLTELYALTKYCRQKNIPVVFWSKEDPVHFCEFLQTASLADVVFTTDADCIGLYKAFLGHDKVYFLPFAAQPKIHNPVEEYSRKDKFCFAGSFYTKYKERSNVFLNLAPLFQEYGLDIYDRNFEINKSNYNNNSSINAAAGNLAFPPELQKYIIGDLSYNEISKAYKGYKYGVNLTSMVQSGFMFARRVFELLACNTVVVSNYSRGLALLFGDLLIHTDDKNRMKKRLEETCNPEINYRKYRLAGLRHILQSHLYEDRLDRIIQKTLGYFIKHPLPKILVLCMEENEYALKMFKNQTYENKQFMVCNSEILVNELSFDYITVFSPNNYYGKNYLSDLALSTRFADDSVIGKASYYSNGILNDSQKAYTRVNEPAVFTRQMAAKSFFKEPVQAKKLYSYHPITTILSLDEFNYCENATKCNEADDMELYAGIPLDKVYGYTEHIPPADLRKNIQFPIEELYNEVKICDNDYVVKSYSCGTLKLIRERDDDNIVWLRTAKNYDITQFTEGNRIGFFTEVTNMYGNVRCQIEYYDQNDKKLGFLNFALGGFDLLRISNNAKTFKLIFRLRGKAGVTLKRIYTSSPKALLPAPFPLNESLLITEKYPSYTSPDVLPKLHQIAKEKKLEVLLVGPSPEYLPYSEYEGIQIVSSQYDAICEYITVTHFQKVYVCSPSDNILEKLKKYTGEIEEIVL